MQGKGTTAEQASIPAFKFRFAAHMQSVVGSDPAAKHDLGNPQLPNPQTLRYILTKLLADPASRKRWSWRGCRNLSIRHSNTGAQGN